MSTLVHDASRLQTLHKTHTDYSMYCNVMCIVQKNETFCQTVLFVNTTTARPGIQ